MKINNETKIGVLVLVSLVSLGILTFQIGNFSYGKVRYNVKLTFENVAGIKLHSPVRISGVDVGEVSMIEAPCEENNYRVILHLAIDEGVKIREDAKVYVTMLGLMGEKYIEITSGSHEAGFVEPGGSIRGKDPIVMEEMFGSVNEGIAEIQKLAAGLNSVVVDNREHIDGTLANLHDSTTSLKNVLADNESNFNVAIANLTSTTKNLDEFSADIKAHPWKLFFRTKEKK